jgi:hypothetical protein
VQNGHAVAEAREELAGHGGGEAISGTSSSALRPFGSAASMAFR